MKVEESGVIGVIVCIWAVTLLKITSSTQVVFTEIPGPGPVVVPVGGHIILNCSVGPGHQILGWRVYVPSVRLDYFTDSPSNKASLASLGITVRKDGSLSSQLIINVTRENLLTNALCEARTGMNDSTITRSGVEIIVYGPPEAPTNLSLSVKDDFLTVIWISSTIPNMSLSFDLVLTNFITSSRKEVIVYDTQRHQFSVADVQACDVLEVLVVARNNAGVSNHAAINGSLPLLPDINTLQHFLSKNNIGGVTLTVAFMIPMPCPVNPVTSYTLAVTLEDSEQNVMEQSTRSPFGPDVRLKVEGLKEKATYTYSIIAYNAIGRTTTASTSFLTTDLQGVDVCLVEGSTYSIQCSYIAGSNNASGCSYVLVGKVDDISDIKGTIDETSTVTQIIPNTKEYGSILVYDEGNSLVSNGTLENIRSCTTGAKGSSNSIYIISGLTTLGVVAVMMILAAILIIYKIVHGRRGKSVDAAEPPVVAVI